MAGPALKCDDYLALPRAPEAWIIEEILPVGGLCLLYGGPKLGKSYLSLQMGAAIADEAQEDWMGFRIKTHGPVLAVQLDTPRSLWAERVQVLRGGALPSIEHVHFADRDQAPEAFDILDQGGRCQAWLRDQIAAIDPVTTILDTIREFHRGNENESEQMMKVLSSLQNVTNPSAVVFIAHDRKSFEKAAKTLMESMRGSNYVAGRMDTIMRLSQGALTYQGRTCEETKLTLLRDSETQLWSVEVNQVDLHLPRILGDPSLLSMNAKAKALAHLTGLSVSTCRRAILRQQATVTH